MWPFPSPKPDNKTLEKWLEWSPEPPPPPPMPEVRDALTNYRDLSDSVARIATAWNPTQLEDAIRSARFWLDEIEKAAKK